MNTPIIAIMGNIFKNDVYLENIISNVDAYYSIRSLVFYPILSDGFFPIEDGSSIFDNHSNCIRYAELFYKHDPTFYEKYNKDHFCFKVKDKKFNHLLVFHAHIQYSFEEHI